MKWDRKHTGIIAEIISVFFIVLFVYAGLTKLLEGDRFFNNLNNSPIITGDTMAYLLSWGVPTLEIIVALLILIPKTRLKGLYGSLGLMVSFTLYIAGIMFLSPYTPCSCGGVITLLTWPQHLVLNLSLIVLVLIAIRFYRKSRFLEMRWQDYNVE